jgi:hypothetical protein
VNSSCRIKSSNIDQQGTCMRKNMWMNAADGAVWEVTEQCFGVSEEFVDEVFDENTGDEEVVLD